MQDLISNRQIRVFISSTFRDMQDERDYLMKRTFPKLRKLAAERDVTLTELDLRWGITEEESKSGKVVEICLREIENSIPFFIGIIGNRYGWVPEKKDLDDNVTERFGDVNDYLERHLSVTEMEMQFGVLAREQDMHAYFYIKDFEDDQTIGLKNEPEDSVQKLKLLKEKVRSSRYPSSTYSSLEDLANQVEKSFINLLDVLFPNGKLSKLEKERIGQRSFMNQLCQNYIKDENNFDVLDAWLADKDRHNFVVTGTSGLGKSALIANWVKEKLSDYNCGYNIIYHFTGNGGSESSSEHITRTIANEINDIYGWEDNEFGAKTKLKDLFLKVSSESDKPLLIVIDAINQIVDVDDAKLLNWLPVPTKGIKILFSTLEEDRTMEVFKCRGYQVFKLEPLDIECRSQMVRSYLKLYAKSLTEKQVHRIVTDSQCVNTLVLKTLLDELINFGTYEKLDERIDYYLTSDTADDFFQSLLKRYEDDFGKEFVKHALSLICLSKDGLKESVIQKLTDVPPLVWSQLYCSFVKNFVVKKGKLNFSHIYVKSAVCNRYLQNDKEWETDCRYEILSYSLDNSSEDTYFETRFQCYMIGDEMSLKVLYSLMSRPEDTATIYRFERYNCINYWKALLSHGYDMHVLAENDFSETKLNINQDMLFNLISLAHVFGEYALAQTLAERQLAIIVNTSDMPKELRIRAYNDVAQALLCTNNKDDIHKATNYYIKAINLADNISTKELAVSFNGLAQCCLLGNKNDLVLSFGKKALELNMSYYGENSHEAAANLNVIAQAYSNLGDYTNAIEAYTKSINILHVLYGDCCTELFVVYFNLADCQYSIKDFSSALQSISRAIEIVGNIFGENYHDMDSYIQLKNDIIASMETSSSIR